MLQWWRSLSCERKKLWKIGTCIVIVGHVSKASFFNYVSEITIKTREDDHRLAVSSLNKIKTLTKRDVMIKLPELSEIQKQQLNEYLIMRSKKRPDLYPVDP